MTIKWNYKMAAKGGQSVKKKKDADDVVTDKRTDFELKVGLAGVDNDIEGAIQSICSEISGIENCTITISGDVTTLKENVQTIAKIISEEGGQQTLDIMLDDPEEQKQASSKKKEIEIASPTS